MVWPLLPTNLTGGCVDPKDKKQYGYTSADNANCTSINRFWSGTPVHAPIMKNVPLLKKQRSTQQCVLYLMLLTLGGCAIVRYSDIAQCAAQNASPERLACYDKLADHIGADPHSTQEPARRGWQVRTETSAIDDSRNVYLSVAADQVFVKPSGQSILPTLVVRCTEDTTALMVAWGVYLGMDETQVIYRIDSQPAQTETWQLSTTMDTAGLWNGSAAIPLVRRLFDAEHLLLRVTPVGDNSVTSTFDVTGLEQAIEPLRAACHW